MKIKAIIVAAGRGTRIKSRIPKALMLLAGQPLFLHALKIFQKNVKIAGTILVVPDGFEARFRRLSKKVQGRKEIKIVIGGESRRDSVRHGLAELDADTDYVLIHDAARPFVTTRVNDSFLSAMALPSICAATSHATLW